MADDLESNLHWKAFLYVTGELDADAMIAFEEVLLESQIAREAVASAVELVQAVAIIGHESGRILTLPKQNPKRRWIGLAFGIAAAAALVASVLIPSWRAPVKVEGDDSSVALAWSGLRHGIDADWKTAVTGSASTETADSGLANDSESAVETSGERPLPSWLLSAASVSRGDSPQEEN